MTEKTTIMNGSVIIIDDDENITELLSEYLLMQDFVVLGIGYNGLDAVNLYTEHKPDFVLMDFAMPKYDGLYGLENIRKINPEAKVIIITANIDQVITKKLNQLHPTFILKKPYLMEKLTNIMTSLSHE